MFCFVSFLGGAIASIIAAINLNTLFSITKQNTHGPQLMHFFLPLLVFLSATSWSVNLATHTKTLFEGGFFHLKEKGFIPLPLYTYAGLTASKVLTGIDWTSIN